MAFLDDSLQPFHVDALGISGRLVRLEKSLEAAIGPHDYPTPVQAMLAQTVALASGLAGMLKYDGIFTLQTQSDGPINLMMADVTTDGAIRTYARFDAERLANVDANGTEVPTLLGSGHLAFTVDQGQEADRYQGITELIGGTLADCAHNYFRQSEQLDTAILLAGSADPMRAGLLMVQRLPDGDGDIADGPEEAWRRGVILMSSLSPDELLNPDIPSDQLLYRLYHQDGVRVTEKRGLNAQCRCSREKVARTLVSFPVTEVKDMTEDGKLNVTCEFCRAEYVFDDVQIDALFDKPTP